MILLECVVKSQRLVFRNDGPAINNVEKDEQKYSVVCNEIIQNHPIYVLFKKIYYRYY